MNNTNFTMKSVSYFWFMMKVFLFLLLFPLFLIPDAHAGGDKFDKGTESTHHRKNTQTGKLRHPRNSNNCFKERYRPKSRFAKDYSPDHKVLGALFTVMFVSSFVIDCAEGVKHTEKVTYRNVTAVKETCDVTVCETQECRIQKGWEKAKECIVSTPYRHFNRHCKDNHKDDIPVIADTNELYSDMSPTGGGGSNAIYKARLKSSRSNIPQGSEIAVRRSRGTLYDQNALSAYCHLSLLKGVTDLYTPIYGMYNSPGNLFHVEMEYVQSEEEGRGGLYRKYPKAIPDPMAFEIFVGEWAERTISTIFIDDYNNKHFGYNVVDYARAYEIGPHIFLIRHPESPRRMDFDMNQRVNPTCPKDHRLAGMFIQWSSRLSASLGKACEEFSKRNFFDLLLSYFGNYTVSRQHLHYLKITSKVKHFKVPEDYIPAKYREV